MSGPSYNAPAQPTYGEGMADAMKAQMEQLLGQGDFADIYANAGFEGGNLGDIIREVEAPLRQQTAQTDTDVLRQTLLGGETGGEPQEVTYDDQGRVVTGYRDAPAYTIRTKNIDQNGDPVVTTFASGKTDPWTTSGYNKLQIEVVDPDGEVVERIEHVAASTGKAGSGVQGLPNLRIAHEKMAKKIQESDKLPADFKEKIADRVEVSGGFLGGTSLNHQNVMDNLTTPIKESFGEGTPIYARDENGEIIQDATKAGMTEVRTLPSQRNEDGMIDLLGDRRNVQEFATRQATQEDVDAGLASEVGDSITEQVGNRQAGFDESGEFLGLSAMAEDIQRGNLSRQREADLTDVERLSGRFQSVMEDYKPAATSGIQGAKDLIEEQKDKLTSGDPTITDDIADTYGGDVTGQTMTAATVADPLQLSANTQFDQQLGREGDTLRQALLGDARTALDSGLTEREKANISNAARARSTLMGRTFDQSGAIEEAQALVAEDNNRLMQNRGFAQSVMGQEAGLQQGDITRGMAQESEQAGLQQQANLAQAQMDQQASAFDAQSAQQANVVNQGQAQQAAQFGVGATMDAERLNEQLRQQGLGNYINAVGNLAQIEDQHTLDPFQAILGRAGGGSLQAGQGVFGQAGYGLNSGPQYLNPEAGLGYISQMAANDANMYAAQVGADASRFSGLMSGLGSLGGGAFAGAGAAGGFGSLLCWVAREVYGPTNPAWLQFREWMLTESPGWFFKLYRDYGERFANWVSDKPRIKSIIRKWMDSKIRR